MGSNLLLIKTPFALDPKVPKAGLMARTMSSTLCKSSRPFLLEVGWLVGWLGLDGGWITGNIFLSYFDLPF